MRNNLSRLIDLDSLLGPQEGNSGGGKGGGGDDDKDKKKKPWDDGSFDAEKAWKLVEALRDDKKSLQGQLDELKPLKSKLQELEDKDKPELERLTNTASSEKKRADELQAKLDRLEVALDKGLTSAQAKRLVGSTRDELEKDADELLETFGGGKGKGKDGDDVEDDDDTDKTKGRGTGGRPKERLRGGAVDDADAEEDSDNPRELAKQVSRA